TDLMLSRSRAWRFDRSSRTHRTTFIGRPPAPGLGPRRGLLAAPRGRVDVGERLGERPPVAGEVGGSVLALPVLVVGRLGQDLGAVRSGTLAVGLRVLHPDDYRVGRLARPGRLPVVMHVGRDHRAAARN